MQDMDEHSAPIMNSLSKKIYDILYPVVGDLIARGIIEKICHQMGKTPGILSVDDIDVFARRLEFALKVYVHNGKAIANKVQALGYASTERPEVRKRGSMPKVKTEKGIDRGVKAQEKVVSLSKQRTEEDIISIITDVLTEYAGPIAKFVINKAQKDFALSGRTVEEDLPEFINLIVNRAIFDPQKRYPIRKEIIHVLHEGGYYG